MREFRDLDRMVVKESYLITFRQIFHTALPVTKFYRIYYKNKRRFDYRALDSIDRASVLILSCRQAWSEMLQALDLIHVVCFRLRRFV